MPFQARAFAVSSHGSNDHSTIREFSSVETGGPRSRGPPVSTELNYSGVVPGKVIASKQGRDRFLAVGEGLVEITGTGVAIVTDMAIAAEHIDEARAEEARRRARPGAHHRVAGSA
jgi:hypothetical protein